MPDQTDYVELTKAARFFPGNPHRNSLKRWALSGLKVRGSLVRLRAVRSGGVWFTCAAWCAEFLEATTAAAIDQPTEKPDAAAAKRRSSEAGKALEALGC